MGNSVMDLIYAMFNQYLFIEAKNNIDTIKYYFDTNSNTAGNPLVDQLLGAIKNYDLASIDVPLFQSILMRSGKGQDEAQGILNEIFKWKRYSKDQIEPVRKTLQDVCASVILRKAGNLYSNSPSEYIKYIKGLDFQTTDREVVSVTGFGKIDINSIVAESANSVIPSRYSWINDSFPMGGYERSQLILVSMPPGSGKSLFCLSELGFMASQGYKTLYLAMGDLTFKDQLIRLSSQTFGIDFKESALNIGQVYESMVPIFKDNLDMMIIPADYITAGEFKEFLKNSDKKYDAIVCDYDSNFKSNGTQDNMYLEYGSIHSVLVDIAKEMNLVLFCACQPKVGCWSNEVIELEMVGESSRKQHHADLIITRSRIPENPNNLGIFKIVKSRRGDVGRKIYTIRLNNGRFIALPKEIFKNLKDDTEKRDYKESDINLLVEQYNKQLESINRNLQQSGIYSNTNQIKKPQDTPFGKI